MMIFAEYDKYKTPEDYGWIRREDVPDIEMVRHFFEAVMECLYKTGKLSDLDSHMEELAAYLEVDFPNEELKIQKKDDKKEALYMLGYQRAMIDYKQRIKEDD